MFIGTTMIYFKYIHDEFSEFISIGESVQGVSVALICTDSDIGLFL